MVIFEKDNKRIFFIHIPKTGGTSIESFFKDNGWDSIHHGPDFPFGGHSHWELVKNILDKKNYNGEPIYLIYRHPLEKLVSSWKMSQKDPDHIRKYPMLNNISFTKYCSRVFSIFQDNNNCFDNHIRPSFDFIPTEENYPFFILNFEDLSKFPSFIEKNHDIKFKSTDLPHIRKTNKELPTVTKSLYNFLTNFYYKDLLIPQIFQNNFIKF